MVWPSAATNIVFHSSLKTYFISVYQHLALYILFSLCFNFISVFPAQLHFVSGWLSLCVLFAFDFTLIIHFHLHFEFHFKLTLYFNLNCILNFKFNVLLNFISVYFVFYISFDLFLSETKIYSTKICEFFVGSSRPS